MWSINLECIPLEILEYTDEEYREDIDEHGDTLEDYDHRIFKTETEALRFKTEFERIRESLSNSNLCVSRALPCMLYKRRYIVLTLMKLKNQTFRHYSKHWKTDQLFNLHDQTYFLTVRLKRMIQVPSGKWRYDFELAK